METFPNIPDFEVEDNRGEGAGIGAGAAGVGGEKTAENTTKASNKYTKTCDQLKTNK